MTKDAAWLLTWMLLLLAAASAQAQKFEGLALTPPMGWNSWNKFQCNVDEQLIRGIADALVSSGMKDAGYRYIVIDDCWHGQRDSLGFIHPDPERFPSGMKALADYIHSKGLKFGIYSDAGYKTCGGRPGSRGFEYQDALTYARWGIDYLKYDWCNTEGLRAEGAYMTMRDALASAGRPVLLSICEWGDNQPWEWGENVGHLWRTTGDIWPCFDCVKNHGSWNSWGVMQIIDKQDGLRKYAGPDHWNDPDMLQVGNGMSAGQDRAHFAMWAMLAAPLMAGNDLRDMNPATLDILTNADIIAVNQDPLGVQGFRYQAFGSIEVWVRPLQNDELAVAFLNRGTADQEFTYDWKAVAAISDSLSGKTYDFTKTTYRMRDLWTKQEAGTTAAAFKATIPAHDIRMFRLRK